jgi:hypothetical protein
LCRKAFKQPPIGDYFAARGERRNAYAELAEVWSTGDKSELQRRESELGRKLEELEQEFRVAIRKCPDCGEPMIDMGLDFKAPCQSDAKAWRILNGMFTMGHALHTCGCDGPGVDSQVVFRLSRLSDEPTEHIFERASTGPGP